MVLESIDGFDGDVYIEEVINRLKNYFCVDIAFETGTSTGYTTIELSKLFKLVLSVEIDPILWRDSSNKLSDRSNVIILKGDSPEILSVLLPFIKGRILFYLDAHWGITGKCPLRRELEVVGEFSKDNLLVIHDFRVPGRSDLGFDAWCPEKPNSCICLEFISDILPSLYTNGFDYFYNDKATGAKRGVLFVTPK
jgi:hypothetical protein